MVMNKDPTWLEAATKALESGVEVWMTAPELVRLIVQTGLKSLKSEYGQAVRTLRAALNIESKKKNDPKFRRKDYNFSCYFALTKIVKDGSVESTCISRNPAKRFPKPSKRKVKTSSKVRSPPSLPLTNGHPPPSSPHTPTNTLLLSGIPTIEINPDIGHEKDGSTGLYLPSPLTSLLGAKRIMNILNDSMELPTTRPVREARKRRVTRDWENEDPLLINNPDPVTPGQPEGVLQLEICHPVPCLSSKVDCVRSHSTRLSSNDPCLVQGERNISIPSIEINPNYVYKKGSESDSSSMDENSDPESKSPVRLQPTPTSQLLVKRRQRRQRVHVDFETSDSELTEDSIDVEDMQETEYVPKKQRRQQRISSVQSISSIGPEDKFTGSSELKADVVDRIVSKPPEQRRHVSTLFLPNSPLLDENLKTMLGNEAFVKLNETQKQKLIAHIPIVDQCNGTRVPGDCFSNSFYSSALREWSERLALGMFTTEYKARVRGEEKRKMTTKTETSWKDQYYERHYGDKNSVSREDSPPPYYPCTAPTPSSLYLTAIVDGYFKTDVSDPHSAPPSPPCPPAVPDTTPPPRTIPISPQEKKNPPKITLKSLTIEMNKRSNSVTPQKKAVKRLKKSSKSKPVAAKTILVSPVKNSKSPVSSKDRNKAISKKSTIKKGLPSSSPELMHKLLSTKSPSLLTRLPAKMSYQEILHNLKAVSDSDMLTPKPSELSAVSYSAPFQHSHSVFHDHFALLGKEHVPIDFCFRVASLPLSLPLCYYNVCARGKAVLKEHSYAQMLTDGAPPPGKSLTLSLPRALLDSSSSSQNGGCEDPAMVFCSVCRSLYHSNCSDVSLCPMCIAHQ